MALGVSLLQGAGTLTLLVAIFFSNLPESLGGAVGMRDQGRSRTFVISVWSVTALLLAASVVAGSAALAGVGERPLAVLLAFATVAGFFLSFMVEKI